MRYADQKPYDEEFPEYAHLVGLNSSGFLTLNIYPTNEQLLFAHECDLINHLKDYGLRSI